MTPSVTVSVNMMENDFFSLQALAQNAGQDITEYLLTVFHRHIQTSPAPRRPAVVFEKRQHARKKVSIPAISCVTFPDEQIRSFPTTIEDISHSGVRVSFGRLDSRSADRMQRASNFETVFSLPGSGQPISLYCAVVRYGTQPVASLAGRFGDADPALLRIVSEAVA